MNLLRRGLYSAFAIIALSAPDCLRASSLYDFVRNFPFAEQESVIQLPYSASDIDALLRALSETSLSDISPFRRNEFVEGGKTYLAVYSYKVAGAPVVVIARTPTRDAVIEAPHPIKDRATAIQAVHLMINLGAKATIISGNNRCAARTRSACSGRTRVCGGGRRAYPSSDPAHNTDSLFHQTHRILNSRWPDTVVVQLHGYNQRDSETLFILSDGTPEKRQPDNGITGRVRDRLRISLGASAIAVSCQDPGDRRFDYRNLCARTNVQGRQLNGSPDACRTGAPVSSGRFLHIEQQFPVRRPFLENPASAGKAPEYAALLRALSAETPCLNSGCAH